MSSYSAEAEVQTKIAEVIQTEQDPLARSDQVRSVRADSFSQAKKASSLQTIMSISNAMVGSSTLLFPMLYQDVGLITALLISILICGISCKTSHLLIEHSKADELDLPETIHRIIGSQWQVVYNISNIILLYLSGMIYMILICDQIYPLLGLIFDHYGIAYAPKKDITFELISYQWTGVGYFCIILPMMCLRNLGVVLKLIPLGIVSVVTFFFFIIYKGAQNWISLGAKVFDDINLVSVDIPTIAGVFTMAFMLQSLIIPIVKNNQNQVNNKRDVSLAFSWTWLVYQTVGIFGALAISGHNPRSGTKGKIVLDYFASDWMVVVVQIFLLLQLTFVFPVLQFITRAQFFGLIHGVKKPPNWQFYGFTLFYALSFLVIQIIEADLNLIVSLCGAFIGMFQIYIIPILLHLTCLYKKRTLNVEDKMKLNISGDSASRTTFSNTQILMDPADLTQFSFEDSDTKCNYHKDKQYGISRQARKIIYKFLIFFGVSVAIGQLINVIQGQLK